MLSDFSKEAVQQSVPGNSSLWPGLLGRGQASLLGAWCGLTASAFPLPRQLGVDSRQCSGLSSTSLGGNGDRHDAVQARKGGSGEGKFSNSMAEALRTHCQGQTLLPLQVIDGWKRKWSESLLSWIYPLTQFSPVIFQQPMGSFLSWQVDQGWACVHTLVHKGPSLHFLGTKNTSLEKKDGWGGRWVEGFRFWLWNLSYA